MPFAKVFFVLNNFNESSALHDQVLVYDLSHVGSPNSVLNKVQFLLQLLHLIHVFELFVQSLLIYLLNLEHSLMAIPLVRYDCLDISVRVLGELNFLFEFDQQLRVFRCFLGVQKLAAHYIHNGNLLLIIYNRFLTVGKDNIAVLIDTCNDLTIINGLKELFKASYLNFIAVLLFDFHVFSEDLRHLPINSVDYLKPKGL